MVLPCDEMSGTWGGYAGKGISWITGEENEFTGWKLRIAERF
jgi:hypothetical protein